MEVVIAISDPNETADLKAAEELAQRDPRVSIALGPGTTAGATRNAGLGAARGEIVAFMDDDCEATPSWLGSLLTTAEQADIVQGATVPQVETPPLWKTIHINPLSWLWETCNLAVRREWIDRVGGFNEGWNPTGRVDIPFGEDAEWGWMLVKAGARYAAAPDAVVRHVVEPRGVRGYLAYKSRIRHFPKLFRTTPEVRRIFYRGYFVNRRHAELATVALALGGALAAHATGKRGASRGLAIAGAALYLRPVATEIRATPPGYAVKLFALRSVQELVEFANCLYGSARWRRLLL